MSSLPAISTGIFGYPTRAAAAVALGTVAARPAALTSVTLIRFVLHTSDDLKIHDDVLSDLIRPPLTS